MTLDDVYPRLLDAVVTEQAGGFTSRHEVRKQLEEGLDKARPAHEEPASWGRQMSAAQWARMKGSKPDG